MSSKLLVEFTTLDFPFDGEVIELNEGASLYEAIKLLTDHSISALPIWVIYIKYIKYIKYIYSIRYHCDDNLSFPLSLSPSFYLCSLKAVINMLDF